MLGTLIEHWGGVSSALGLLAATVWMVLTGRLVTRRSHEESMAGERRRGDDWRDAYRAEAARNEVRDAQMNEVLAFVRRYSRESR